jgi:transposase
MPKKKKTLMDIVHHNAAGVDVGSRSHFVAIGQGDHHVREFGVYAQDHNDMIPWLKQNGVIQIAMESTGDYWQNLYSALQAAGFQMTLAIGKFTKNIKGKKSDVKDCQWIQKLH